MKLSLTSAILMLMLTFSYGQISIHFHGGVGSPSGLKNKPYHDFDGNISYFGGEVGFEITDLIGVRGFYNYGQSYIGDGSFIWGEEAKGIFREAGVRPWFDLSFFNSSRLSFIMCLPVSWYRQEYNWSESVSTGLFSSRYNRGKDTGEFLKYGVEPTVRISLAKMKFIFEGGLSVYGNHMLSSSRKVSEGYDYSESKDLEYDKTGFMLRLSAGYLF